MSSYTEELESKISIMDTQLNKTQESLDIQISEILNERVVRDKIEKLIQELEEALKIKDNQLQVVT